MSHGRDHQREFQGSGEARNCGGMEGAPNQLGAQVGWAQRQKAKNELGLDKARRTEAGVRLQRGIQRNVVGKMGRRASNAIPRSRGLTLKTLGSKGRF